VFYGLGGNDTMSLDLSNGSPLTADYIAFAGGTDRDTLHIEANQQYGIGAATDSFLAGGQRVLFAEVEAISLNGAAGMQGFAGQNEADRAQAFAGLTADERFVQAVYLDALGRAGSTAELDGWLPVLHGTGGATVVADGIE